MHASSLNGRADIVTVIGPENGIGEQSSKSNRVYYVFFCTSALGKGKNIRVPPCRRSVKLMGSLVVEVGRENSIDERHSNPVLRILRRIEPQFNYCCSQTCYGSSYWKTVNAQTKIKSTFLL